MRRTGIVLAALAILVPACGGDDDTPSATPDSDGSEARTAEPTTTTTVDSDDAVRAYFEGFVEATVESMRAMIDNSVEGSIAGAYALHQRGLAQAQRDAGQTLPPGSVNGSFNDDVIRLCQPATAGAGEDCSDFAGFEEDADTGKLTDFTIDGTALTDRIILGNGQSAQAVGATVVLVSAYQSVQNGALFAVFDVTAGDRPVIPAVYSATYVAADGRQSQAGQAVTPANDLQAGAKITVAAVFEGAALGGRVSFEINSADFLERGPVEFTLA